jgi:hypothetical protein
MYTQSEVTASRSDIIIKNKKEKTCTLVDVAIPADRNVAIPADRNVVQTEA